MDRRDSIDNLWQASLMSGFHEENYHEKLALTAEDESITQNAGYTIPNPTYEKINRFVTELVSREFSDLTSLKPLISTELNVGELQGIGSNLVKSASGIVKYSPFSDHPELTIELPFLVINGELVPFDVIQVGKERCPYSKENAGKIIMGFQQAITGGGLGTGDGMVGLEKMTNPTTTTGFMSDTLNVRARGNVIPDIGGMFVTAEEKSIDKLLKEAATIKPYNWEETEKVARALATKKQLELIKEASDIGEEISVMVKTASVKSDQVSALNWVKMRDVKPGTYVKFPEKDGRDINMTAGKVIGDFDIRSLYTGAAIDNDEELRRRAKVIFGDKKVLITSDNRMMVITPETEAICLTSPDKLFKFTVSEAKDLKRGDICIFKTENGKFIFPRRVRAKEVRTIPSFNKEYPAGETLGAHERVDVIETDKNLKEIRDKGLRFIEYLNLAFTTDSSEKAIFDIPDKNFMGSNEVTYLMLHKITPLSGVMDTKAFLAQESELQACSAMDLSAMLPYVANPKKTNFMTPYKKVIIVRGSVGKTFSSVREMEDTMYGYSEENFESLMKVASANETIDIQKNNGKFNITLNYTDRDSNMYSSRQEKLTGLSEEAALGALIALNFDKSMATDCMLKATKDNRVSCHLPQGSDPNKIFGSKKKEKVINSVISEMKDTGVDRKIKSFLKGVILKNTVVPAVAHVVKDSPITNISGITKVLSDKTASEDVLNDKALDYLCDLSKEAEALSLAIEKTAREQQNGGFRKVAKCMALCSHFADDLGAALISPDKYPHLTKLASDIVKNKETFENVIGDLVFEKTAGYYNQAHKMPVTYYGRAVHHIDVMYQAAKAIGD